MRQRTSPELQKAIADSRKIHQHIASIFGGLSLAEPRIYTTLGFCSTALEHQIAIANLIEWGFDTSTQSLLRCLLEAAYRGLWTQVVATESQLDAIRAGAHHFGNKIQPLIKDVDAKLGFNGELAIPDSMIGLLNGFVHTGIEQLGKQYDPDGSIQPSYTLEQMWVTVAVAATHVSIMASVICAKLRLHESMVLISGMLEDSFPQLQQ